MKVKIVDKVMAILLPAITLLYLSQGLLIPEGEIIGQILLLSIWGISAVYLIKGLLYKVFSSRLEIAMLLFLLLHTLYFALLSNPLYTELNIGTFKGVLLNFLPVFSFLYLSKINVLTRRHLLYFFFVALPLFAVSFFKNKMLLQDSFKVDDLVTNAVYPLIGLLPFAFLFKRKVFTISSLLIIWFILVQSNKRAAIVAGVLAVMLFGFQLVYASDKKHRISAVILGMLIFMGVSYVAYSYFEQNDFLMHRMELMFRGDSTGRDSLIKGQFSGWYNPDNMITYLFGIGYNSSVMLNRGMLAHNDWVDMLVSFGLLGLTLYTMIWYYMSKELVVGEWDRNKRIVMLLFLGISFIASMFFRWYNSPFPFMTFMILPYLLYTKEEPL